MTAEELKNAISDYAVRAHTERAIDDYVRIAAAVDALFNDRARIAAVFGLAGSDIDGVVRAASARDGFFRRWRDLLGVLRLVANDSDYDAAQTQAVATVGRLRAELKEALVVVAAQDKAIGSARIYMETQRCTEHAVARGGCAVCNAETRALGAMADAVGDVPA